MQNISTKSAFTPKKYNMQREKFFKLEKQNERE